MEVLKKPLFFIPVILIILPFAFAVLVYFNILPLPKLLSPSQTPSQIPAQTPTKGKALNPKEPILLPASSSTKSGAHQTKNKDKIKDE